MPQEAEDRIPQSGEMLVLTDGRRFVMAAAEAGVRGWWFTATAQDGGSTLQGNLQLAWDAQAHAWRPARATESRRPVAPFRGVRRSGQPRVKHSD